ncbi:MAG: hypothetical protein BYD32DRAFT_110243 [Podila humilis]|nr:MAG: hypothetical protein BYD32DRAFT_110243 [Podila humilis]
MPVSLLTRLVSSAEAACVSSKHTLSTSTPSVSSLFFYFLSFHFVAVLLSPSLPSPPLFLLHSFSSLLITLHLPHPSSTAQPQNIHIMLPSA